MFDIVIQLGGKVHGSHRERDIRTCLLDLLVYYEVPEGKREKVKTRFEFIKNKSRRVIIQNQEVTNNNIILLLLLQILYSNISNSTNTISNMIKSTHE